MSRHIALIAASLLVASGCVPSPAGPTKPTATASRKPGATATGADKASPRPLAPASAPRLPAGVLTRVVEQAGIPTQLTGKVKLISDHGAALVSNNSGSVLANNGSGLISDGGGGLVSNNSGSLVSNNSAGLTAGRSLAQAAAPPALGTESTLVDATVYVHDARGQALVRPDGQPIAAVSDGQGGYRIDAVLPAENLVLRVRLWTGGELAAILPKTDQAVREVAVDTAATLGATYVLTQYVKGDPATFEKLPASEVDRLNRDLGAARGLIERTPAYTGEALVALTDDLRAKAPTVDQTLTQIKALLLGQANLGGGKQATAVPLADPRALVADGDGFMVSEGTLGRLRRVGADGTITTYADQIHGTIKENFYGAFDLARAADGTLYVLSAKTFGITTIAPDGTVKDLVGTGRPGRGTVGKPGLEVATKPWTLWLDPDGTAWIGEEPSEGPARVLSIGKDGVVREPAPPAWDAGRIVGLARAGDGALYALNSDEGGQIWKLAPGASAWTKTAFVARAEKQSDLAPALDGGLLLSEDEAGRVVHLALDGTRTVLSDAAAGSPIKRPTDLQPLPDGRIRVIDGAGIRVYELAKDGTAKHVAGTGGQGGDLTGDAIALNGPFAAAYDAAGRLVVTETGAHALTRWDGVDLTTLAGGVMGQGGDGGPASSAQLDQPAGIAVRDGEVLILDQGSGRIRAVGADGKIRSIVGATSNTSFIPPGAGLPGKDLSIANGAHLAVGADGSVYWASLDQHQVARLAPDGTVTAIAGLGKGSGGDGGAAADAKFNTPVGVAWGPDGHLYVADCVNMRVRRVEGPTGASPTVQAFAGVDGVAAFGKLADPQAGAVPAAEAVFAFPSALCFDKAGNLYVAEFGTLSMPLLVGLAEGVRDLPLDLLPKVPARIRKITPDGQVTVVAGPGSRFFGDPEAGDALVLPTGLAIDPQGRLVIVDAGANLIRFLPAGAY